MHTKDILAEELRKAGLPEMADKAATGYYHDFLSPLSTPCVQLALDLKAAAAKAEVHKAVLIMAVLDRHLNGEFDASLEESDEWASGPDGRAAFDELSRGRP